jgi:hypothetical protein
VQLSLTQLKLASQSKVSQPNSLRIGARLCLNASCERTFQPTHHLDRYCGPECLAAARRWQRRFANQLYRQSPSGKLRRAAQSQRYRIKLKERQDYSESKKIDESDQPETPREGYTKETSHEKSCCHRPGCYQRFTPPPQSPLKKFCSPRCRKALRRVILRERMWYARLKSTVGRARDGPRSKAS